MLLENLEEVIKLTLTILMTSLNKKKKARNSYTEDALKFGKRRKKRICFF